jgi:hypothetical protein
MMSSYSVRQCGHLKIVIAALSTCWSALAAFVANSRLQTFQHVVGPVARIELTSLFNRCQSCLLAERFLKRAVEGIASLKFPASLHRRPHLVSETHAHAKNPGFCLGLQRSPSDPLVFESRPFCERG